MNSRWLFLACASMLLSPTPAHAQTGDADVVIVEDAPDEETVAGFLRRHGFASLSAFAGYGTGARRHFASARGGLDMPFRLGRSGRLYLEGALSTLSIRLDQKFDGDPEASRDIPRTRTVEETEEGFTLYEAYLDYEPVPDFVLSVGRKKLIWGQFDIFSPTNLLLPLEFQSPSFGFDKANFRMPQNVVSLSWFPHERVELRAYYFNGVRTDPLYENAVAAEEDTSRILLPNDDEREDPRARDDFDDYNAAALQAFLYADDFTASLTLYRGRKSFSTDELPILLRTPDAYNLIEHITLPKAQAVSFGLSVPYARWTWKAEAAFLSSYSDIDARSQRRDASLSPARRVYYDWIVDENEGRAYLPVRTIALGFGFDADYDAWRFGAALFYADNFLSDSAKEGDRLQKRAFDVDAPREEGFFPNIHVFYELGGENEERIGFVGGLLGIVSGASLFYDTTWRDALNWNIALEYIRTIGDVLIHETQDERGSYELEKDFSLGLRLGASYRF